MTLDTPPMDPWPLPPELPWPQFLRLLRRPDPPKGWLDAAAALPEMRRRPLLLRWIAQHRKAPAPLRLALLSRLPWRALAAIAMDASAHPQAVSLATERLLAQWGTMGMGERRTLARLAPRQLWPSLWKVPDAHVLRAFLEHPRLDQERLGGLVQPPLTQAQAMALQDSRWAGLPGLAMQVLWAMDATLALESHDLVLGMAAPWIKVLEPEARVAAAARLQDPTLRRLVRIWGGGLTPDSY